MRHARPDACDNRCSNTRADCCTNGGTDASTDSGTH